MIQCITPAVAVDPTRHPAIHAGNSASIELSLRIGGPHVCQMVTPTAASQSPESGGSRFNLTIESREELLELAARLSLEPEHVDHGAGKPWDIIKAYNTLGHMRRAIKEQVKAQFDGMEM